MYQEVSCNADIFRNAGTINKIGFRNEKVNSINSNQITFYIASENY